MDIGNHIYHEGQIDNYKALSLAGWNWMKIYRLIILINYLRQRLAWVVVAKLEVHYNGKWKMQEGESSTKLDLLLPLFGRYCIGHLR